MGDGRRLLGLAVLWLSAAAAFAQNQPPTILFASPVTASTYEATAMVFLRVAATDPDGTITKVEYYANGALLGAVTTPPFGANLTIPGPGTYSLTAKAFDNAGATTTSSPSVVTVYAANPGNAAPSVSLGSPLDGSTYTAPAGLLMYAAASDSNGTINRVEYYLNGLLACVRTTAPYGCSLAGVPVGTHALTAKAFDDQGKATTSSAATLSVLNPDPANVAPTISLWSPINNAVNNAPASLWVRATAADSDGGVNRVEYFVNGALLALTRPAQSGVNWSGVGAGTYSILARVWDNKGKFTDSAPNSVAVNNPVAGNGSPAVGLALPVNDSVYEAPGSFDVVASASDSDGAINRVEFFYNGSFYGVTTATPYGVAAVNAPAGTYTWAAVAFDNQGASTTSMGVRTVVNAPDSSNTAPSVSLSQPANDSLYAAPAAIPVSVSASDPDGSVNRVELFVNGGWVGTWTAPPYDVTLNGAAAGAYAIVARAWDNLGKSTPSAAANVTVLSNAPPTVSIGAPANGTVYQAPGNVALTATAADGDGAIGKVEFYRGATLIGTATAAPYTATDAGLAAGNYSYTARAYDNFGAATTSAPVNVIVNAAPTVAITAPASNTVVTAPAAVNLAATAADTDGAIGKVEFYRGATLVATVTNAPYTASDPGVPAGTYSYTARAYDNRGGITTSAPVTVISNMSPTISITAPASGTVVNAPGAVNLTASAADADGTIAKVEFHRGATLIATVTAAPYAATDPNVAAGTYSYTARAYDNNGGITTSPAVPVTVNALPSVALTSPSPGASLVAPANVALGATAADTDGTISKVEFYRGPTLVAATTAPPYAASDSAVPAGTYSYTARAYDNSAGVTISAAVNVTVTDNAAPMVSITAPAGGTVYQAPASIGITASASDNDGSVSKVEFYGDATLIGTAATAPYALTWANVAAGSHVLTARAYDSLNATTASAAVNVTVNAAPTVSITAPASGTVAGAPASVNLAASASDTDGTISKVEFYRGAIPIATATATPYAATDPNVPPGTHSYAARAYDNNGGITTSATVTVISDALPMVAITAPASGAVYQAPGNVTLTASASDSDGTISKVEFYQGATLIGTVATAPYTYNWTNVASGSYAITARAYDNHELSTSSAAVNVTVNAAPTVAITAPANNAVFAPPGTVNLAATATDSDGTIGKVEFYRGATLIATATAAPYGATDSGLASGSYSYTARAHDNNGGITSSAAVAVTVNALPSVTLTSPAAGAFLIAPANVSLAATAADSDGTISKVEFYRAATLVATATAAPYAATDSNLAVGSYSYTASAYDNSGGIATSSTVSITVSDNAPPTVSITNPADNAVYQPGTEIVLVATSSDPEGALRKVEFYRGSALIATATAAPYTATAPGLPAGAYQFTAKAYDAENAVATSAPITVIVNASPAVAITAPASGAVLSAPASVTLTTDATDSDGTIDKVEFYNGTTLLGTASGAPFSLSLTNLAAGPYALTAKAFDNNGGITTSAPVNVTVTDDAAATPVFYQYDELGRLIGVQH